VLRATTAAQRSVLRHNYLFSSWLGQIYCGPSPSGHSPRRVLGMRFFDPDANARSPTANG
jgi:hypothetical protein